MATDRLAPETSEAIRTMLADGYVLEASNLLRQCLEQDRGNGEAMFLMARVARIASRPETALEIIVSLVGRYPARVDLLIEQADLLIDLKRPAEAVACYRQVLKLDFQNFAAHFQLGRDHANHQRWPQACYHLNAAARAQRDALEPRNLLGHIYLQMGSQAEAETVFTDCLTIDPRHFPSLCWLGTINRERGRNALAIDYFLRALEVKPDDPQILRDLGHARFCSGDPAEAIPALQASTRLSPTNLTAQTNLVAALNYVSGITREAIAEAHRECGRQYALQIPRLAPRPQAAAATGRPLRLGLMSADFCQHPVGHFAAILACYLDRSQFELFGYECGGRNDAVTKKFKTLVSHWRPLSQLDDESAARAIQADEIDILVDLCGHTGRQPPLILARKPAPMQVSLFAYPNTTGLDTVDYRFTDPQADPPGANDQLYTEKLLRLSRVAWVYLAPENSPEPRPSPALSGQPFTFGCLNNSTKLSHACIRLWGALLRETPAARLKVLIHDEFQTDRLRRRFVAAGANPQQLLWVPTAEIERYLNYFHDVDLALDPFPYNGGVSTGDALWMGIPVLTLTGASYVSRQGVSLLTNVGLTEGIATDEADYLARAKRWATAPATLAPLRYQLRERLLRSPLMDYSAYAEELGAALLGIWNERVA